MDAEPVMLPPVTGLTAIVQNAFVPAVTSVAVVALYVPAVASSPVAHPNPPPLLFQLSIRSVRLASEAFVHEPISVVESMSEPVPTKISIKQSLTVVVLPVADTFVSETVSVPPLVTFQGSPVVGLPRVTIILALVWLIVSGTVGSVSPACNRRQ